MTSMNMEANSVVLSQGIGQDFRMLVAHPWSISFTEWIYWLSFCPTSPQTKEWISMCLEYRRDEIDMSRNQMMNLQEYVIDGVLRVVHSQGELSILGFFDRSHDITYYMWKTFSWDYIYTAGFREGGQFVLISGVPGSGKTHLAVILAGFCERIGVQVLTNIGFSPDTLEEHPRIHVVRSFSTMVRQALEIALKGGTWVCFLDEAGVWNHRQRSGTKSAINWDIFLRLVRKMRGSLVFIEQKEGGFSSTSMEFCSARWLKQSKDKKEIVHLKLPSHGINTLIKGIPDVPIPFETHDLGAGFAIDFDMEDALESVSEFSTVAEQQRAWIKFLGKK